MTLPNELHPGFFSAGGGGDVGDTIGQSLRFRNVNYLANGSLTIQGTSTMSMWVKVTTKSRVNRAQLFGSGAGNNGEALAYGNTTSASNVFISRNPTTTSTGGAPYDTAVRRDFSAWYHCVLQFNSSLVTTLFVNGVQQSNTREAITTTGGIVLGNNSSSSIDEAFDGYMADVHYVDGQILNPTSFGRYNGDGVWVPQNYSGSYGTNGFHLTFDSSQANGIGHDSSGNNSHFTATGFDTSDLLFRSQDVYGDNTSTYDNTNTNKIFLPDGVSYGPERMFDGDLVNDACKSGTGTAQTWIYWRPDPPLSISSSLVVHCSNTADVRINGTSTGQTNDGTLSNFPITIANPPATLTELAIQGNSISSATIYGIVVDGTTLTENRDNDVDYLDTPTSNYPTINPLYPVSNPPQNAGQKDANLGYTGSANLWSNGASTMKLPSSGEYYWEHELVLHSDHQYFGVTRMPILTSGTDTGYISFRAYHDVNWYVYQDTSLLQTGTWKCCTGNIISQAYNIDTGVYRVWIDGSLVATNTWSLRPTDEDLFIFGSLESKTSNEFRVNYGQRPFLLATELGFGDTNKLLSNNTPEPTIKNGKDHFDVVTYSGTGVAKSETGLEFQPDFVWIKERGSTLESHILIDSVRGNTSTLRSNTSGNEVVSSNYLTSFDSNGFSLGTDLGTNGSSGTYVAWCWKAGGTAVSNGNGTITSSVSANTDAGFSIVSWTGTQTASQTVGHGLSEAPDFVIYKARDEAANWIVGSSALGATEYLILDVDNGATSNSTYIPSRPTNSVLNLGSVSSVNNDENMIAYCWHSVEGFSKFGSYNGGGSGSAPSYDGPFIYLGFKPSLLLIKRSNAGGDPWILLDSTRDTHNFAFQAMRPNTNNGEISSGDQYAIDFLSNGFKCRSNNAAINNSTATYVYAAFAESPFGGENVPPATAR